MDINSAFNPAITAFQRAEEGMQRSASTVARIGAGLDDKEDLNTALVEATQNRNLAQVSVNVINSVDETLETLGKLIDTRA